MTRIQGVFAPKPYKGWSDGRLHLRTTQALNSLAQGTFVGWEGQVTGIFDTLDLRAWFNAPRESSGLVTEMCRAYGDKYTGPRADMRMLTMLTLVQARSVVRITDLCRRLNAPLRTLLRGMEKAGLIRPYQVFLSIEICATLEDGLLMHQLHVHGLALDALSRPALLALRQGLRTLLQKDAFRKNKSDKCFSNQGIQQDRVYHPEGAYAYVSKMTSSILYPHGDGKVMAPSQHSAALTILHTLAAQRSGTFVRHRFVFPTAIPDFFKPPRRRAGWHRVVPAALSKKKAPHVSATRS